MARNRFAAARRWREADGGVSEVVGSILLVGITIVMAVIAGALILSRPGPVDTTRPSLIFAVNPGSDGMWGTGNENVSIYHTGGDMLSAAETRINVQGGTPDRLFSGNNLGGPFAQASGFRIGTTWYSTTQSMTISSGTPITINVVVQVEGASKIAGSTQITAGST